MSSLCLQIFQKINKTFWFDLFLEARAEILEKNPLVCWKIWRHQKDILKLFDLYTMVHKKLKNPKNCQFLQSRTKIVLIETKFAKFLHRGMVKCCFFILCHLCFVFNWAGIKPWRSPNRGVRPSPFMLA